MTFDFEECEVYEVCAQFEAWLSCEVCEASLPKYVKQDQHSK